MQVLNYGLHSAVGVCVCRIELWLCAISLTSALSHSSQLNHGNRLYGQNAVLAVRVSLYDHAHQCVCYHGNNPKEHYMGVSQKKRRVCMPVELVYVTEIKKYKYVYS